MKIKGPTPDSRNRLRLSMSERDEHLLKQIITFTNKTFLKAS